MKPGAAVLLLLAAAASSHPDPAWAQPAPGPPPLPAPIVSAEAIEPGGARVTLAPNREAIVDPASTFRVVLPGRSDDARLSLLDADDALVPATGAREVGGQTVLALTPRQPLTPAARYVLWLDGRQGRNLHDAAGRAASPVEWSLVAAGSPPEPPKKATKKPGRRRPRPR